MTSRCIGVCQFEADNCIGCGRTIRDIIAWSTMSAAEPQAVMERVAPQAEAIHILTRDALD